jgi:ribosomal protein L34E
LRGQLCILASRLHIYIQMLVLFSCFGYVVINHQKGGDCKENGPRAIWLIEFWCLMNNTIRELISFFSVYVYSSQDARSTWTKELRKATPQNKTLRRSKKSPRLEACAACGLSVRGAPDCPVAHRTVRCPHTGLSGAPGNSSPTASSRWHPERRPPDCPVRAPDCPV